MPEVEINGRIVTVERFTLAKAMRVITLLQLLQKKVPEISCAWGEFRKDYAESYATEVPRINAMAQFGPALEHITEADWDRADQTFRVPGSPSQPEVFFAMAPLIYERAEEVTLRLLGLVAMENELVNRYVAKGDIWERVDELVDEIIKPAALDEIMELGLTAAEVIDGQVLQKAKSVGDRAGNVARLFGWKTKTTDSEESGMSSESPVQPSTVSVSSSPGTSSGDPMTSDDSNGTSSTPSKTSSTVSATTS
jgi:hypothetical protein